MSDASTKRDELSELLGLLKKYAPWIERTCGVEWRYDEDITPLARVVRAVTTERDAMPADDEAMKPFVPRGDSAG